MASLRVAQGTFVTWHRGSVTIGHSGMPFRGLRRGAAAVEILAAFTRARDESEILDAFEPHERSAVERLLADLKSGGYLVATDAETIVDAAEPAAEPSAIKDPGFEIGRFVDVYPDIEVAEPEFLALHERCKEYTLLSVPLLYSLYGATRYVVDAGLEGDVVECGVWRGGALMLAASTLAAKGDTTRRIFLYDTFDAAWERPAEVDGCVYAKERSYRETATAKAAGDLVTQKMLDGQVSEERVLANMRSTGYPPDKIVAVRGLVQDTLPNTAPEKIAILRLDTDFFESTYHELVHLYPRLVPGGVLIVDDYGKHRGATEATDKYFAENGIRMLLHRVDVQGRIGIKPSV